MQRGDLRRYYETEARLERRRTLPPSRQELCRRFIALLKNEKRRHVVDFGSGPGLDLHELHGAEVDGVGIDIALQNCRIAHDRGITVLQASAMDAPFRDGAFDAGISMSAFMHLEPSEMSAAATELARCLGPGAPVLIGMWGDPMRGLSVDESSIEGQRRPFFNRSVEENAAVLSGAFGSVVAIHDPIDVSDSPAEYQVFELRAPEVLGLTMSIKGVLVIDEQVVLLANERSEWELPGGRPDPNEAHPDTLRREFSEELGVDVVVDRFVDTWTYEPIPGRRVTIHTYVVEAQRAGVLRHSDEHVAVGRFDPAELGALKLPAGYRSSIRRALRT